MLQALVSGVLLGGLYALVALGLNLIYGVLDVINFAHGASMMVAMYGTWVLWSTFQLDPYISIFLVAPAMFCVGYAIQRILLEPLLGTPASNQFLTTLGILLVFQYGAQVLFTSNFRTVQTAYSSMTFYLGSAAVPAARLGALIFAIAIAAGLFALLKRTDLGRAIQAAAQDPVGAAVSGINVRHVYGITFGLGLGVVGAAGAIAVPLFYVAPTVGDTFNIPAFIVVVLGGLGSMPGALLGGLLVGVTDSVGAAFLPGSLKQVALLLIFIGTLMFKPTGLLGRRLI